MNQRTGKSLINYNAAPNVKLPEEALLTLEITFFFNFLKMFQKIVFTHLRERGHAEGGAERERDSPLPGSLAQGWIPGP